MDTVHIGEVLEKDMRNFKWDIPNRLDPRQFRKKRELKATMWMGQRGTVTPMHLDFGAGVLV